MKLPNLFLYTFAGLLIIGLIILKYRNNHEITAKHESPQIVTKATTISVKLEIQGVTTNTGQIRVAVYNSANHFLKLEHALFKQSYPANSSQIEFSMPETSDFAIGVYHDSNNDGVLNKHFLGYPIEKYGFSNNPVHQFGSPAYGMCKITHTNPTDDNMINQIIHLK